jgi:hypothetical protein
LTFSVGTAQFRLVRRHQKSSIREGWQQAAQEISLELRFSALNSLKEI